MVQVETIFTMWAFYAFVEKSNENPTVQDFNLVKRYWVVGCISLLIQFATFPMEVWSAREVQN